MPSSRKSTGRAYDEQPHKALDEAAADVWPSPNTCFYPTPEQADSIVEAIQKCKQSLQVVSIGCGDGACEAQLEARGLTVFAVDLDVSIDYTMMCRFCTKVLRIRSDVLFDIPDPRCTALCFFWGRALPWRAYLEEYPEIPMVIIAGEPASADAPDCATEPRGNALDQEDGWALAHRSPVRAVHGGACLSVYVRGDGGSNGGALPSNC